MDNEEKSLWDLIEEENELIKKKKNYKDPKETDLDLEMNKFYWDHDNPRNYK